MVDQAPPKAVLPDPPPDRAARRGHDLAARLARGQLPKELHDASGMRRLNWILDLTAPNEFVASLATEELYLLIRDIGGNDAYPLLEYASEEQLQGIIDIDVWQQHKPMLDRWVRWLDLAKEVDLDTAFRFIRATEPELIELLFCEDIKVHTSDLETDTVPDSLQLYESPDGVFYVTIDREHPLADQIPYLMKLCWAADMGKMLDIFQASRFELPSALTELLAFFRRGRLEDMGFVGPDEAAAVYRTVDHRLVKARVRRDLAALPRWHAFGQGEVMQDLALTGVAPPELLAAVLAQLDDDTRRDVGQALTYLVNKVFMARTGDLSRTEELALAADEAVGLVNLGLAHVSDEDVALATAIVPRLWPEQLLHVGNSLVMELRLQAKRVRARAGSDAGLHLFGTPIDELLEGLSRTRPLYYEGLERPGVVGYRPFDGLDAFRRAESEADKADAVLGFFERRLGFSPGALLGAPLAGVSEDTRQHLTLETLLRTGLAHALLDRSFLFAPLSLEDAASFLQLAFDGGALTPRFRRALDPLFDGAGRVVALWIEATVERLRDALGAVPPAELDPRYLGELLLVVE